MADDGREIENRRAEVGRRGIEEGAACADEERLVVVIAVVVGVAVGVGVGVGVVGAVAVGVAVGVSVVDVDDDDDMTSGCLFNSRFSSQPLHSFRSHLHSSASIFVSSLCAQISTALARLPHSCPAEPPPHTTTSVMQIAALLNFSASASSCSNNRGLELRLCCI